MLLASNIVMAQKYFTKTGLTEFKASVENFEPIEAKNESTTVILNTETGALAALLFIKAFNFEIALMQEHFNENYMDSDKFPKATFKGLLIDFNMKNLSSEEKKIKLKGTLTIRGKDKIIDTTVTLKKEQNKIVLTSEFTVKPEEFNIVIPGIVREKIAKSINLNLHYEFVEKK
ncbi:YceI-like domain-containing protein [Maribacter ulvicola]|uniref:YceI-like domain-containing protein n=2 Tax=Maribacter ulvicola TaxID=228959 RepID=A0A1N6V7C9_9FLAO|nr:YceI-like domain-containing protein [Maribacter ulvicola]